MKTIHIKKEEIIQRRGELNSKIYSVEMGLLRTYSIDVKGREHVFMFAPEGWIVADASAVNGPCELLLRRLKIPLYVRLMQNLRLPMPVH